MLKKSFNLIVQFQTLLSLALLLTSIINHILVSIRSSFVYDHLDNVLQFQK